MLMMIRVVVTLDISLQSHTRHYTIVFPGSAVLILMCVMRGMPL